MIKLRGIPFADWHAEDLGDPDRDAGRLTLVFSSKIHGFSMMGFLKWHSGNVCGIGQWPRPGDHHVLRSLHENYLSFLSGKDECGDEERPVKFPVVRNFTGSSKKAPLEPGFGWSTLSASKLYKLKLTVWVASRRSTGSMAGWGGWGWWFQCLPGDAAQALGMVRPRSVSPVLFFGSQPLRPDIATFVHQLQVGWTFEQLGISKLISNRILTRFIPSTESTSSIDSPKLGLGLKVVRIVSAVGN